MIRRKYLIIWIAGACLLAAAGIAFARQADPVTRWLIGGGGGGKATGGNVSIFGAAGQPVSGAVESGSVKLCSGFWCGGPAGSSGPFLLTLPQLMTRLDFYAPACGPSNNYCEENDDPATAYGPLGPGRNYSARPDDERDYYYIEFSTPRTATFTVTGFQNAGWLQIYDADDTANDIGSDNKESGGEALTVTIANLAPGKYYIRVFNSGANTTAYLYTLKADY